MTCLHHLPPVSDVSIKLSCDHQWNWWKYIEINWSTFVNLKNIHTYICSPFLLALSWFLFILHNFPLWKSYQGLKECAGPFTAKPSARWWRDDSWCWWYCSHSSSFAAYRNRSMAWWVLQWHLIGFKSWYIWSLDCIWFFI